MYLIKSIHFIHYLLFANVVFSKCLIFKNNPNYRCKFNSHKYTLFFVNYLNRLSQLNNHICFSNIYINNDFNNLRRDLKLNDSDSTSLDVDVERILLGVENPHEIGGPYIAKDGMVVNKKKKLYSTGELCHVDDFYEGKFRVEWTVRGVREVWKLQYRYRDTHTLPLNTSRFSLAGIKGFILRLWLDGHKGSKKGYIAVSLVQQEHWSSLDSPICLFAGKIVKGPFFYRSPEYFNAAKSLCRLEEVLENNSIKLGVMIATRDDLCKTS